MSAQFDPVAAREHLQGREIQVYGTEQAAFNGITSYKADYPQHQLEMRPQGQRPSPTWQGNQLPFDGETTYKSTFQEAPLPERYRHPPAVYQPSPAQFDGCSTYKEQYKQHQLETRSPMRATGQYQPANMPFDGTTSYKNDFVQHAMPERPAGHAPQYALATQPFDGATTYKSHFIPHEHEARARAGPTYAARESLPFDGQTTYADTFKTMPILPPHRHQYPAYQPNTSKFEGTTENMDAFKAWALDPNNRRGGPPPSMRAVLPFEGTTTNKDMFKGWQLPPKRPALGLQMLGDKAYVLIPGNAPLPALGRQTFTTVHENQTEISLLILEGDFSQASRCSCLGQFDLVNLPPGPPGAAKIEVTFHINESGVFSVTALDTNTHRQEQWLREGYMVARV